MTSALSSSHEAKALSIKNIFVGSVVVAQGISYYQVFLRCFSCHPISKQKRGVAA